jgi:hypothetical protein
MYCKLTYNYVVRNNDSLDGQMLHSLLTTCSKLKELRLRDELDQQGLHAILTLGSHLTSLSINGVSFTESRAGAPACSLKSLELLRVEDVRAFINVPLQAVQSLSVTVEKECVECSYNFFPLTLPGKQMWLPAQAEGVPPDQVPALVRQAAVNLAACPALHGVLLTPRQQCSCSPVLMPRLQQGTMRPHVPSSYLLFSHCSQLGQ